MEVLLVFTLSNTGVPVGEECWVGDFVSFGNHVGDWEHVAIRLMVNKSYSTLYYLLPS
jgi:hypothetical protein